MAEELPLKEISKLKSEEEVHLAAERIAERVSEIMRFDNSDTLSCFDTIKFILKQRWLKYVRDYQGTTLEVRS